MHALPAPHAPCTPTCPHSHLVQFTEEQYKVVYKRPTDLRPQADVPICCNLVLANILDEGVCVCVCVWGGGGGGAPPPPPPPPPQRRQRG